MQLVDPLGELALRDQVGAGKVGDRPLLGLADVDEERRFRRLELGVQRFRFDFGHGSLGEGRAGGRDTAEGGVVDETGLGRDGGAKHALRVLSQLQLPELEAERVVQQEPTDQRLAAPEDEFHRLGRLEDADESREHAEHPGLGARRHQVRGRRLGIEAAITGAALRVEDAHLALEAVDRPVDVGFAEKDGRVVDEIAGREIVGAVDDDVVSAHDVEGVLGGQALLGTE